MKKLVLLALIAFFPIFKPNETSAQNLKRYKRHVLTLADDSMMGRDSRRPEIWKAAAYIQKQYEDIGLDKPHGDDYYQRFTIPGTSIETANVIGIIRAKDPTDESIIFTAHYDGLGVGKADNEGDSIYNGALDNAVGTAALIELAADFKKGRKPEKNLIFIATSAEEIGSHGSKAYLQNPIYPAHKITFALNIDGFNVYGKTSDIMIMPRKGISYYSVIAKFGLDLGFEDTTPGWVDGLNTSFDSSVFLASGIPSITIWSGDKIKGMTSEEVNIYKRSIGENHHSPNDEVSENWRWTGIKDHFELYKKLAQYFLKQTNIGVVTKPELFNK